MTSQFRGQAIAIHVLLNISRSKDSETIRFGQLIEYHVKDILFLKNHTQNMVEKLLSDPFI